MDFVCSPSFFSLPACLTFFMWGDTMYFHACCVLHGLLSLREIEGLLVVYLKLPGASREGKKIVAIQC